MPIDLLSTEVRVQVLAHSREMSIVKNAELCSAGSPVAQVFMVLRGEFVMGGIAGLGPGSVFGALDCLRGSVHHATVTARAPGLLFVWERDVFLSLLEQHRTLASAILGAETRMSEQKTPSIAGGLFNDDSLSKVPDTNFGGMIEVVERAKRGLRDVEKRFRGGQNDENEGLEYTLTQLLEDLETWSESWLSERERTAATQFLLGEIEPYLSRSSLADALMGRTAALRTDKEVKYRLSQTEPSGSGAFGRAVDEWVRNLPSIAVLSASNDALLHGLDAPETKIRHLGVFAMGLQGAGELLVRSLSQKSIVAERVTMFAPTVGEANGLAELGRSLMPQLVWEGTAWSFSLEDSEELECPQADVVLVSHALESLPSRYAVRFLAQIGNILAPQGMIRVTTLDSSPDSAFLTAVLRWPSVGRPRDVLLELFLASGLAIVGEVPCQMPGIVIDSMHLDAVS